MSGQSEVFINLLRQVELFSGLSDAELRQIAETAVTLRRAKNQIIFDEGDSADFLLVLTKGRAKVVLVGDGAEEIILNLIEPFRVLGEIALLDRSTRSARLAALEDCQFIKVPVTAFDALRNSNPAFAAKIIANVTATLRESNDQLRVICTYRSLGKGCVVPGSPGATERDDQRVERNARIRVPKHHELAQMTGCSRETVSRALKMLKQKNCITPGPGDAVQVHAAIARYTKRPWPASARNR
jgi:CRP-like cAMP-binding protein